MPLTWAKPLRLHLRKVGHAPAGLPCAPTPKASIAELPVFKNSCRSAHQSCLNALPQRGLAGRAQISRRLTSAPKPPHSRTFVEDGSRLAESKVPYNTENFPETEPIIHSMFENQTGTLQYVVADPETLTAVIVDPVLEYDPVTQAITTSSADSLVSFVKEKGYKIDQILETHAHADHLTSAFYLQNRLSHEQGHRPVIAIGKRIELVQGLFGQRYGVPSEEYNGVFDILLDDDETFNIGKLTAVAIHLPGHTPDHMGYKIGGTVLAIHFVATLISIH